MIPALRVLTQRLSSPRAEERAHALAEIGTIALRDGFIDDPDAVEALLDDAAPFVARLPEGPVLVEVRARALETLQAIDRAGKRAPTEREVHVRRALRVAELEALERQHPDIASDVEERAATHRAEGLAEDEAGWVAAYEALDTRGLIERSRERTSPHDGLTDTQRSLQDAARTVARPEPHLVVRTADRTVLGWVYKKVGRWTFDFLEGADPELARHYLTSVLTGIDRKGMPRVVEDEGGQPRTDAGGAFVLDGVLPLATSDERDVLRSLQAFARRRYPLSKLVG